MPATGRFRGAGRIAMSRGTCVLAWAATCVQMADLLRARAPSRSPGSGFDSSRVLKERFGVFARTDCPKIQQDNGRAPVLDLGPDAERVAPPDELQQHAVRVRDKRVLVGRAAGEELLWREREAQRLAELSFRPRVELFEVRREVVISNPRSRRRRGGSGRRPPPPSRRVRPWRSRTMVLR